MVKVNYVEAKEDYVLLVQLSNGKKGYFDVKPYLDKGIFTELKDKSFFTSVRSAFGGVVWPHEQDFSADTIEYEMRQI
ncbi:MAG TPA: DUF2442 domain-containing protein [Candidatus Deferrimicrobium sp.]|jgi:hypothetical protein|nr:DUF2442 domain-containing protein [Candidatus Kapabacteria bacterium]HLP62495.1 DUF2442 domain-containing protein [Candidatus Deferrimicrobium sp.]